MGLDTKTAEARIRLIASAAMVTRFHTMPPIRPESVGEHTFIVAMLVDWLSEPLIDVNLRYRLLKAALFHDMAEAGVGDIPSPVKRKFDSSTAKALRDMEDRIMSNAGYAIPVLSGEYYRIQKMADILAGMLKCAVETEMGNKLATIPYHKYKSYLESFRPFTYHETEVITAVSSTSNLTFYAGEPE